MCISGQSGLEDGGIEVLSMSDTMAIVTRLKNPTHLNLFFSGSGIMPLQRQVPRNDFLLDF